MSNVKAQMTNQIQSQNVKKKQVWVLSFDIDLTFRFCYLDSVVSG